MAETSFALYRKYRPDSFKAVRNQDHIVSVLQGSITKKMIPHALLFEGPRGTGKTTVARIFAHEIGAQDIDIYEIDAASNRGIDDIRALKEAVHTLPYESPYKVYIIDEVHMLTKEAWNALLKTLEEPPEYVVFILATTEREKILDTIISRCQVFTFRTPTRDELKDTILEIAKNESCTLSQGGAGIIALAAQGSYRDALSIMQKVIMVSGDTKLDDDEIASIVGAPRGVSLFTFIESIQEKNLKKAMQILFDLQTTQVDMRVFLLLLIERVRAIMLLRHSVLTANDLGVYTPEERTLFISCAYDTKSPLNSTFLLKLLGLSDQIRSSHIQILPLELAVIETLS